MIFIFVYGYSVNTWHEYIISTAISAVIQRSDRQMALLQHGTVNFTDKNSDRTTQSDGPMTFAHAVSADTLSVHFCPSPFEPGDRLVRDVVESIATMTPQAVSVLLDAETKARLPELPISLETYCSLNSDVVTIDSISTFAPNGLHENGLAAESLCDVILFIGGLGSLRDLLQASKGKEKTVLFFPSNLAAQTGLHALLDINAECTLLTLINTHFAIDNNTDQLNRALARAVEIAITSDSQFYHWIEGNASQLQAQQPDTLANFVARYCVSMSDEHRLALTQSQQTAFEHTLFSNTQLPEANKKALTIAMKSHLAVQNELLPDGADARIVHLLQTLQLLPFKAGDSNSLKCRINTNSGALHLTLPVDIGDVSEPTAITTEQLNLTALWLQDITGLALQS